MFVLQILAGALCAVGTGYILTEALHLPSHKAVRAMENLSKGRREREKSVFYGYLRGLSKYIASKLRLSEYKRLQLETDLRTAGSEKTPEEYCADALTKSLLVGIMSIPAFLLSGPLGILVLFAAVFLYYRESRAVGVDIAQKRQHIEYELPRMAGAIEKTLKHSRDVIYVLESYKDTADCRELKEELERTIADMRSGSHEAALTRLEARIGSTMMSDVTRGLIAVERGDDTDVYWASLSMKFADHQRQKLKLQANSIPRKVRKLSMALLCCFILIYAVVICQVLLTSMTTLF